MAHSWNNNGTIILNSNNIGSIMTIIIKTIIMAQEWHNNVTITTIMAQPWHNNATITTIMAQ